MLDRQSESLPLVVAKTRSRVHSKRMKRATGPDKIDHTCRGGTEGTPPIPFRQSAKGRAVFLLCF